MMFFWTIILAAGEYGLGLPWWSYKSTPCGFTNFEVSSEGPPQPLRRFGGYPGK